MRCTASSRTWSVQRLLHLAHDLVPGRGVQVAEEPAVHEAGRPVQPHHLGIFRLEVHEPRLAEAGDGHDRAVELREGLIAVLGERLQELLATHARPGELALVAVPVADEHVQQPGAQVGAGVDAVLGALVDHPRPDLVPVVDLLDVLEAGSHRRFRAAGAPRGGPSMPPNSFRNSPSAGSSGITTSRCSRCVRPRASSRRSATSGPAGYGRADLILGHPLDEGVAIFRGEGGLRVLVDGAHAELAPVSGLEAQRLRLRAAALLVGLRPPAKDARSSTSTSIGVAQSRR